MKGFTGEITDGRRQYDSPKKYEAKKRNIKKRVHNQGQAQQGHGQGQGNK